ncbi:helix-turn-helix transcriptional regulator [Promicromonospora citrea]|nr:helix-turn-helix transcriptional regulator [Promicromonospora citrea]
MIAHSSSHDPLARLRRRAGLTQEELAERAGVAVRSISNIERGAVGRPRVSTLRAIGLGLGLDGVILVFETDLTQIWSVERRRRYGPQLAGMAVQGVLLAGTLLAEVLWRDAPLLRLLVLLNLATLASRSGRRTRPGGSGRAGAPVRRRAGGSPAGRRTRAPRRHSPAGRSRDAARPAAA